MHLSLKTKAKGITDSKNTNRTQNVT